MIQTMLIEEGGGGQYLRRGGPYPLTDLDRGVPDPRGIRTVVTPALLSIFLNK